MITVTVGGATVSVRPEEGPNRAGVTKQSYDLDELLHAVGRVVAATASPDEAAAVVELLTAARIVLERPDRPGGSAYSLVADSTQRMVRLARGV